MADKKNKTAGKHKLALTHIDVKGEARMVDVSAKPATERVAVAEGQVVMTKATLALIESGNAKKGDVLGTARIAGIMAAKRTSELIPLCHPLALSKVTVQGLFPNGAYARMMDGMMAGLADRVLNMSELTSLAYELPFTPPVDQPMWYHQTVSIFQKEVDEFCEKIRNKEYDLVIFETVSPKEVLNFFPMDVKACLMEHYQHEFTFLAPRHPEESFIDVFTKPQE